MIGNEKQGFEFIGFFNPCALLQSNPENRELYTMSKTNPKPLTADEATKEIQKTATGSKNQIFNDSIKILNTVKGQFLTPKTIAEKMKNSTTADDVRHAFQSKGYKGNQAIVNEVEKQWLNYRKSSGRVEYGMSKIGTVAK